MARNDSSGPDFALEKAAAALGFGVIAGVDEAGRGPWAGPVVAAAVVLDAGNVPDGLDDSKKLPESRREELFGAVMATAEVGIAMADVRTIDRDNILNATLRAMADAVKALPRRADHCLVDGNRRPDLPCGCETVVKGDGLCLSIAAASIVAKVSRDRVMREIAEEFPEYGFDGHKGYGTLRHRRALERFGPCPHHRRSFAPVGALSKDTAGRRPLTGG